jgi:hypothetical protein
MAAMSCGPMLSSACTQAVIMGVDHLRTGGRRARGRERR